MFISEIKKDKKLYMNLLLIADESENMINRYLERGTMYVLNDNGIKNICVVTNESNNILEIKNIVTVPKGKNQGYGKKIIKFVEDKHRNEFKNLQVGTGK